MTARAFAAFLMLLTGSALVRAQTWEWQPLDPQSGGASTPPAADANATPVDANAPPAADAGPKSPQWSGLSVKDKLIYDGRHFFDTENFVFAGIGAGLDQWRDRPSEWGEGWGAFGERYASHIGQYGVQRAIMFPVQAI